MCPYSPSSLFPEKFVVSLIVKCLPKFVPDPLAILEKWPLSLPIRVKPSHRKYLQEKHETVMRPHKATAFLPQHSPPHMCLRDFQSGLPPRLLEQRHPLSDEPFLFVT